MRHVEPNDVPGLPDRTPSIALIACNGAKAHELLLRSFGRGLDGTDPPRSVVRPPWSSPSNAATSLESKRAALAPHVRPSAPRSSFA